MRWQPIPTGTTAKLLGVWCGGGEILAVGERGTIVRGTDDGLAPTESGTKENLYAVAAGAGTMVAVGGDLHVGGNSLVLHREDGPFVAEPSGMQHILLTVSRGAREWVAAGYNGAILSGAPGSWRREDVVHYQHVFASCAVRDRFLVGGLGGSVLERTGQAWEAHDTGVEEHIRGLSCTPADDVVAVGLGGLVLRLVGRAWQRMNVPTAENLEAVCAIGGDLFAVGARGTAVHHDGGAWRRIETGTDADLFAVHASGSTIVAVGSRGTALRLRP